MTARHNHADTGRSENTAVQNDVLIAVPQTRITAAAAIRAQGMRKIQEVRSEAVAVVKTAPSIWLLTQYET